MQSIISLKPLISFRFSEEVDKWWQERGKGKEKKKELTFLIWCELSNTIVDNGKYISLSYNMISGVESHLYQREGEKNLPST